jgi:hypothetical protein
MDSHISEFSYGYALTSELISLFSLQKAGAPEFATQYSEGKKGGGWDLKIPGHPIYLQFKRATRMVRRTAQELPSLKALPIFRMHLHRRDISDQHQLLLDLEARGSTAAYAAPGFTEPEELNEVYSQKKVATASVFVRPRAIGPLPDDKPHWVAFRPGEKLAFFCSRPRPIPIVEASDLFPPEEVLRSQGPSQRETPSYSQLADELLGIYSRRRETTLERQRLERIRHLRDERSGPDFVRLITRTLLQCEILFDTRW